MTREELNPEVLSLFKNEAIVKELATCKNSEECYNVAKPYIADVSFEDFKKYIKLLKDAVEEHTDGFLDMQDLDEVAGGTAGEFWKGVASGALDALTLGLL